MNYRHFGFVFKLLVVAFGITVVLSINAIVDGKGNYITEEVLKDGEVVTRIHWNRTTAIALSTVTYLLKQITDHKKILTSWYKRGKLVYCDIKRDYESIKKLISQASISSEHETQCSGRFCLANSTNTTEDLINSIPQFALITNRKRLIEECKQFRANISDQFMSKRNRRAELLLFPGTNWCGKGTTSKSFRDLGRKAATDRCCRDHDYCKHTISPFTKSYHLFNYRPYVISHCECDERFRACLRLTNTASSNLIGKIFFNIVQTKCFVLKAEKICKKRSWWGTCLKKQRIKRAHLHDGLFY